MRKIISALARPDDVLTWRQVRILLIGIPLALFILWGVSDYFVRRAINEAERQSFYIPANTVEYDTRPTCDERPFDFIGDTKAGEAAVKPEPVSSERPTATARIAATYIME